MRIALTRDSVCMADDIEAPHADTITFADDATLMQIAKAIQSGGYLAYTGGATRHVEARGAAVVFGSRWFIPFAYALGEPLPLARHLPELHFRYHAQREPAEVRARVLASLAHDWRFSASDPI